MADCGRSDRGRARQVRGQGGLDDLAEHDHLVEDGVAQRRVGIVRRPRAAYTSIASAASTTCPSRSIAAARSLALRSGRPAAPPTC
jgi:hypothetical protein